MEDEAKNICQQSIIMTNSNSQKGSEETLDFKDLTHMNVDGLVKNSTKTR